MLDKAQGGAWRICNGDFCLARNRRRGAVFRKSRRRQSNVASARANAPENISGIPRP